jgi:hypothetical protein
LVQPKDQFTNVEDEDMIGGGGQQQQEGVEELFHEPIAYRLSRFAALREDVVFDQGCDGQE